MNRSQFVAACVSAFCAMTVSQTALSAEIQVPAEIGQSIQLSATQAASFNSGLLRIARGYDVLCYRNLSNYGHPSVLRVARERAATFIDQKTNDVYNRAYLNSTLPSKYDKQQPVYSMTKIAADEYVVSYQLIFQSYQRNEAFTDIQFGPSSDAEAKHFYKVENGKFVYQHSNYDLVRRQGMTIFNTPHIRCGAVVTVSEPGLLWGTNESRKVLPPKDVQLSKATCRTSKANCDQILSEPYIIVP